MTTSHPFERVLSVSTEEIELQLRGIRETIWDNFWLNPRRLRGSDFLMRWSQGVWSEKRLIDAINKTNQFYAIPYGPSGTAPADDIRAFELYFERLDAAGLGNIKRPDLLVFKLNDKPFVYKFLQDIGGDEELPFMLEKDLNSLIRKAIVAVECENSLWVAEKMPDYNSQFKPQKRQGVIMRGLTSHQKLPSDWHEREKLRDKGQFWTPGWIAEAMVSYVSENTELVFDPATGRGAFFDAFKKLNMPNISYFGIDIDSEVLQDDIYNNPSCFVELRDFIKNPPQGKFKAIIANPPYIRHHRIDTETKLFLKQLCTRITGFSIDGRAGYHIYFLIQALNMLDTEGKLAFIIPADSCEGTFAKKLWKWITEKYCLECVVTFDEKATPFPNVDTNAIIVFIKKSKPLKQIYWVKARQAFSKDLHDFILSCFRKQSFKTITISKRQLAEALDTGLSRPEQNHNDFKYHLNDFARVMRGIATGANDFFFLTRNKANKLGISDQFLKVAVGRTRDATGDILTKEDVTKLGENNRPTLLFSISAQDILPKTVEDYLKVGEEIGLPNRPLIKQRNPWYKMEKREVPPLLFAYLGRRNSRFIRNEANVLPLTGFLCVYPMYNDEIYINNLWEALNHPDTLKNLQLVGKSYGSGAIKVEPRNLDRLPIPAHVVEQFNLKRPYMASNGQYDLFREPKKKYSKPKGDACK